MSKATEEPLTEARGPLPVLTEDAPHSSVSPVTEQATESVFDLSSRIGAYRTADHRYWFNGQGPYPSVTTVLKVLDKAALVTWAKQMVARTAVDRWEEVGALIQKEGAEAAKKWLVSLPDFERDQAAALGTSVHLLADLESRGEQITFELSEAESAALKAWRHFLQWLKEHHGEIVSSEKMVWSAQGYAGTYDLLIRLYGELWLLDLKHSKGYYPEYALQLIAYGSADSIILEDNPEPYPMPIVQRYGVLHLRPDQYTDTGWRLIEYPLIPSDYMAFLGALEIWKWKEQKRYTKSALSKVQKLKAKP